MNTELPVRKHPRLKGYDYSQNGMYFITLCVKDRHEMLGTIVGRDVRNAPPVQLSEYGVIADKHINNINAKNKGVFIDKHLIMPNHIHMIIAVQNDETGAMRTSRPTNTVIPSIMRSFKGIVTKEIGFSLWQRSFHDRIIRNEAEYQRIYQYIEENPAHWQDDDYH
jgi:REP element-mobilizing transposase RayT